MGKDPLAIAVKSWLAFLSLWAGLGLGWQAAAATSGVSINSGSSRFDFVDDQGDRWKTITVYTHLPKTQTASAARIVFVMHGYGKNAKGMRDTWVEHADKNGWLIAAPLFDSSQWVGGDYATGGVMRRDGGLRDPALWSFSVIEHLFEAIKKATGNQSADYFVYGHSEGGQFVHRLVLFLPEARFAKAIAANPGWYTLPTYDTKFPYGLSGTAVSETALQQSFSRPFILLLGDRDTDPNHPELRRTRQAMAQGAHRFARGQTYMKSAERQAQELKSKLAWLLETAPGVAHDNVKMSRFAAALLAAN